MLREEGYEVDVNSEDKVLSKDELLGILRGGEYDAVLCLLTDVIDKDVFDASSSVKIFSNYAVGYNNIDIDEAKQRGIMVTNTPGVLTDTVAEHTVSLLLSLVCRIPEADKFVRDGKYEGWAPEMFLGNDLKGKTLGLVGAGRIGSRVAHHLKGGFDMNVKYYDVSRNDELEKEYDAEFVEKLEDLLPEADVVSIHVPLLDSTKHLINEEMLSKMKKSAYLVNTSRGAVIDEEALVRVLRDGGIKGAGLDVFENEPELAEGLAELSNTVLTPHIASATEETRSKMAEMAADSIIKVLNGEEPENLV